MWREAKTNKTYMNIAVRLELRRKAAVIAPELCPHSLPDVIAPGCCLHSLAAVPSLRTNQLTNYEIVNVKQRNQNIERNKEFWTNLRNATKDGQKQYDLKRLTKNKSRRINTIPSK